MDADLTTTHPDTFIGLSNEDEFEGQVEVVTDNEDKGEGANQSTSMQGLADIRQTLSTHTQLLFEILRFLEGSSFINEVIEKERVDDRFMEKFKPFKTGADFLNEDWQSNTSEGESTDNEDYIAENK
ncbi:hypothetical protein EDD11_009171 [Mortierella claussenii]|nr:hypothetical protein EDD11_009171 [Mortierella claussenii]